VNVVVVFLANSIVLATFIVPALTVAEYSLSPTNNVAFLIVLELIRVHVHQLVAQAPDVAMLVPVEHDPLLESNSNFLILTPSASVVFTLNETTSIFSAHLANSSADKLTFVTFKAEDEPIIVIHEPGIDLSVTSTSFSVSLIVIVGADKVND
jgi:hypothetical protein